MSELHRTALYNRHVSLGAKIVDFSGWEMPIQYSTGIVAEHLATRKGAGLFDVSHMGRFIFHGEGATAFLQHVLTNNVAALDELTAQYTIIPNAGGGAIDDAYLYRFKVDEYMLVVNAANREEDWRHFQSILTDSSKKFGPVELLDRTDEIAMLSLQGPRSREILQGLIDIGQLPEPARNALSKVTIRQVNVQLGRTGYTGEPLCFELFPPAQRAAHIWDCLVDRGVAPVGLGARDTLRLEAALPLYGHELGADAEGRDIPIFACPLAKFAVSFSPLKGDFIGRVALLRQYEALARTQNRDYSAIIDLPRTIRPVALLGRGVARQGAKVFKGKKHVGYVTSGTMVPFWSVLGEGLTSRFGGEHQLRSIGLAYIDSDILDDDRMAVEVRGKNVDAQVVSYHMQSQAPPYARPIVIGHVEPAPARPTKAPPQAALALMRKAVDNTRWRQRECVNLIPSEMTISPPVRLLSISDPAFRYAEHRENKAFNDLDIFYYQGTDFVNEVERLLEAEMVKFLGAQEVEARIISGQMANATVFSAMVDFLNRSRRKDEPRRMSCVMNNHIARGGHLSVQPMGALKDFVAHDPRTERPAVVNFPVLADNPYKMDVSAACELIDLHRPELVIFGKSMVLHPEPIAEIRRFIDEAGIDTVLMYDMAHVLGLIGRHFQQPFVEGADLVTGSTHKTFFGTQRGVVAGRFVEGDLKYDLWQAIRRRAFPGAVSNHHLGTLVGLLMATYEMNHFAEDYQPAVLTNAKAFARALARAGLSVAGDPVVDYTETHQVVVNVGYGRGPEIARRLEERNIICNYQAAPDEESFTAAGSLRMGAAEMTRFGMDAEDFAELAQLVADVIIRNADVREKVKLLRSRFDTLQYCFSGGKFAELLAELREMT